MKNLISSSIQNIKKSYFLQGFIFAFISFLIAFFIALADPPFSPYRPGETLNPNCSPADPNCTVSPPLPTYISTTTLVELNNNLLTFSTGTVSFLGINVGIGTTTPSAKLHIIGNILASGNLTIKGTSTSTFAGLIEVQGFRMVTGAQNGYVLTSDDNGVASWQPVSGVLPFGTVGQTLRHNGTNWVANSFLYNNGTAIGIGTTTPQYTLDVSGTIRATKSITAGMNVATLTADIILTPGVDPMYQWLRTGDSYRIITLTTSTAKTGDKFVIKNNDPYNSSFYLQIRQGTTIVDFIYAGTIKEYIFDGTNWRAGGLGGGGMDNNERYNLAIGANASGYNYGTAVGYFANGYNFGTALGYRASGDNYGTAVGYGAYGFNYGSALGYQARGMKYGVAVGYQAGYNIDLFNIFGGGEYNVLLGAYAGYQITTGIGNIIIGYQSGYDSTYSPTTGSNNILIGFQAGTPSQSTSNFLNIGNLIFATGINTATGSAISNGNVGIGTTTPATRFQVVGTSTFRTILPESHNAYDLGSATTKWRSLYVVTSSVGDLVFANQFRFTESTSTSGEELLILKNQRGEDVLTIDERGNLTILGKIIALFDEILDWLKDKIVQVKELIADKIFVKEVIIDYTQIKKAKIEELSSKTFCLEGDDEEKICIGKNQLKELLQRNGIGFSQDSGGVNNSGSNSNSDQENNQQNNNQQNNNQGYINQSSGSQGGGEQQSDSQQNNGQGNINQGDDIPAADTQGNEGEQDDSQ